MSHHTSSYIDNQHFLTILENCGYFPIFSKPMQILYNSIKNSLKMHGDYPIDSLVDCICSCSGISKEELLEDHTLFEKSLRQFFGEGEVDIITDLLKKGQISSKYATFTNNLIINNILWDICSKETFEFITKIPAHEHIVIIYKNENSIGKLASKILAIENAQSESSSSSLTKMPHVNTTVDKSRNLLLLEKLSQSTKRVVSRAFVRIGTRLSSFTSSKVMNNKVVLTSRGCHDENHMIFSQFREPDVLTLCAYNILDLYNFDIDKLITSHSYVILDDPFIAFKKGKEID